MALVEHAQEFFAKVGHNRPTFFHPALLIKSDTPSEEEGRFHELLKEVLMEMQ